MTRSKYAEHTEVPVERSKAEIEGSLMRYGCSHFISGWTPSGAMLQFIIPFDGKDRLVKFELAMPTKDDKEIKIGTRMYRGEKVKDYERTEAEIKRILEQEIRRRWRALALIIKAKLEAVSSGIVLFEEEFLAHFVMPNGQTLGRWMSPKLTAAYKTGEMPLLALPGSPK